MMKSTLIATVTSAACLAGGVGLSVVNPSVAAAGAEKCYSVDVQYTDGADVFEYCGGNNVTRAEVPDLLAASLHISCSDDLLAPTKSDLDGHTVTTWTIVKSHGDACSSEDLGDADKPEKADKTKEPKADKPEKTKQSKADKAPKEPKPEKVNKAKGDKPEKCIAVDVLYTDGTDDVFEICGTNNVTRDDVPDLEAISLHISCSDDLYAPEKSDLGGKTVERWTIVKDGDKVCGDPVTTTEPNVEVIFDCYQATIVSDAPVEDSTVLFADGTSEYVWGEGRTTYTVTSDGSPITAVFVDGVRHDADPDAGCYVS